jgi:hypothetical protein
VLGLQACATTTSYKSMHFNEVLQLANNFTFITSLLPNLGDPEIKNLCDFLFHNTKIIIHQ